MQFDKKICGDCSHCLEILQIVADGEASPQEIQFFEEHICECSHCKECFEVEQNLRICLQQRLEKRLVPQEIIHFVQCICGTTKL